MKRFCKFCSTIIPPEMGKGQFCSPACRFAHIYLETNSRCRIYCPICGTKLAMDRNSSCSCSICKQKLSELGLTLNMELDRFISHQDTPITCCEIDDTDSTWFTNTEAEIQKKQDILKQPPAQNKLEKILIKNQTNRESLIKDQYSTPRHGVGMYARLEQDVMAKEDVIDKSLESITETFKSSKSGKSKLRATELSDTRVKREIARFNIDTQPITDANIITQLEHTKDNYNSANIDMSTPVVECISCPAYYWAYSKYFDQDHLENICMADMVKWKTDYLKTGKIEYTYESIPIPHDKGKCDCKHCKHGNNAWIPRYDDMRGWYLETPNEFITSFERFCASIEKL